MHKDPTKHFWKHVYKTDSCWIWIGAKARHGYGSFRFSDKTHLAHRISYLIAFGTITNGMNVLHQCDNKACVNPSHLFEGTQLDNIRDMFLKGRNNGGRHRKFSNDIANEIRSLYKTGQFAHKDLANRFRTSARTIGNIIHHRYYE